ncbi:putative nuclease HARBI1 [Eupeodes corollae]|uniref:putative nuclease HARBI1 n=1 Tax=Eupeodes corollae TaxID=290404 RepID=UPI00248F96CA|nr:putative nuclease HARBI1 [Eupeodes corollae]
MHSIGFVLLAVEEEETKKSEIRSIRRELRDNSNPLELPQELFIKNYRINKNVFKYLLDTLSDSFPIAKKSFAVPKIVRLSACLRFFAEGGYQRGVGKDHDVGIAQSTFSEVLSNFLNIFEENLCPEWIKSQTAEEQRSTNLHFFEKYKLPGVIGCIDGTHVRIVGPHASQHLFFNRKGFYSLNVLLICDEEMKIRFVDATHPGACHDSLVWKVSEFRSHLLQRYLSGERNFWLLGDAGYPLAPWLLTPHRTCQEGSPESKFNKAHKAARKIIEQVNGVLKGRWRCILGARELHYEPQKAIQIVNTCCALHNMCIFFKISLPMEYQVDSTILEDTADPSNVLSESDLQSASDAEYLAVGQELRRSIGNSI